MCAPNTGGESFGIVLAEAMAAGTPVVASDIEAFRRVLTDPDTGTVAGVLLPPGDAAGVAAGLAARAGRPRPPGGPHPRRAVPRHGVRLVDRGRAGPARLRGRGGRGSTAGRGARRRPGGHRGRGCAPRLRRRSCRRHAWPGGRGRAGRAPTVVVVNLFGPGGWLVVLVVVLVVVVAPRDRGAHDRAGAPARPPPRAGRRGAPRAGHGPGPPGGRGPGGRGDGPVVGALPDRAPGAAGRGARRGGRRRGRGPRGRGERPRRPARGARHRPALPGPLRRARRRGRPGGGRAADPQRRRPRHPRAARPADGPVLHLAGTAPYTGGTSRSRRRRRDPPVPTRPAWWTPRSRGTPPASWCSTRSERVLLFEGRRTRPRPGPRPSGSPPAAGVEPDEDPADRAAASSSQETGHRAPASPGSASSRGRLWVGTRVRPRRRHLRGARGVFVLRVDPAVPIRRRLGVHRAGAPGRCARHRWWTR